MLEVMGRHCGYALPFAFEYIAERVKKDTTHIRICTVCVYVICTNILISDGCSVKSSSGSVDEIFQDKYV